MIVVDGAEHGQAKEIAAALTSPERRVTADMVRDWARRSRDPRDRLHGLLPGVRLPGQRTGTTWYQLRHAAKVAAMTEP